VISTINYSVKFQELSQAFDAQLCVTRTDTHEYASPIHSPTINEQIFATLAFEGRVQIMRREVGQSLHVQIMEGWGENLAGVFRGLVKRRRRHFECVSSFEERQP
jgi:hypothetical protein